MSQNKTQTEKSGNFFGGAAILAVGIVVVKIIGMFYKVPLNNILGEQGTADFNNAYNIYAVLLTISTAGLPVALSKMVSEANALGQRNQVDKIFKTALAVFLILGTASFLIMSIFADQLAAMMHDSFAAPGIRMLAPAVICVGCLSAFRGYFQGHGNMTPTAVSQILEAVIKLFLGLALASYIMSVAFNASDLITYRSDLDVSALTEGEIASEIVSTQTSLAAAGAIAGVTVGTIVTLIFLIATFYFHKRRNPTVHGGDRPQSGGQILATLLKIAIPISLASSMVGIVTVIDASLVQGQLQNALGMTEEMSRTLYGNYAGALTIYNLPMSLIVAITASVIPAVSAARASGDRGLARNIVASSLRITAIIALPMGVGLMVLGTPIIALLFPSLTAEIAGPLLSTLGLAAIFVCIMQVGNSVLHAHGYVRLPIVIMLIGGGIKIFTNYNLVAIESIGVYGAPVGNVLCFGTCLVLNLIVIARVVPNRPAYLPIFAKPVLAAAIMGVSTWATYGLSSKILGGMERFQTAGELSWTGNALSCMIAIGLSALVYVALIILLRAISREDLALMPKGDKIAKLLRL